MFFRSFREENLRIIYVLLEIFDGSRDAKIMRSFKKQSTREDSTWKGMRCFLFLSPLHDLLRRDYRWRSREAPECKASLCCKLTFGAIFKYTTHCWKSCGVDNLEQMAKTDNFGTTWVENVNRVNLYISATWRQTSASTFADESIYCDCLNRSFGK